MSNLFTYPPLFFRLQVTDCCVFLLLLMVTLMILHHAQFLFIDPLILASDSRFSTMEDWKGFPHNELVKNPPAMRETWVWSLGWEDPLEKEMANHSSILLENSMDRGAWQAVVHGVAKSWTRLGDWTELNWDECNCVVVWAFFGIAFLWDWKENWPFPVLWPLPSFPNLLAYWVQNFPSIIFQDLK